MHTEHNQSGRIAEKKLHKQQLCNWSPQHSHIYIFTYRSFSTISHVSFTQDNTDLWLLWDLVLHKCYIVCSTRLWSLNKKFNQSTESTHEWWAEEIMKYNYKIKQLFDDAHLYIYLSISMYTSMYLFLHTDFKISHYRVAATHISGSRCISWKHSKRDTILK